MTADLGATIRRNIVIGICLALFSGVSVETAAAKKASPPATFEASGRFALPNTLAEGYFWVVAVSSSWGITGSEFALRCAIPETQELDGYVIELPDGISNISADISLDVSAETVVHDTYMVFFDANCQQTQMENWEWNDDGKAVMAAGTKYILVTARVGGFVGFDLKAVERR